MASTQPPSSWEESGPLVSAGDWGGGGAGRSLQPSVFSDPRCFARVESIWGSGLGTAGGPLPWFLLGVHCGSSRDAEGLQAVCANTDRDATAQGPRPVLQALQFQDFCPFGSLCETESHKPWYRVSQFLDTCVVVPLHDRHRPLVCVRMGVALAAALGSL